MENRRKWRRGLRPTLKQPQSTCSSPPWNPFSRKAGFSPHLPRPAHSTMSRCSPPRPGSWRSLPPRWAAAEESCPRRSGCGKRVLAAPCVRREWSCCKMVAEAHAAGSKPDPVPLASERAPGARARARVTPPPLSLPSLARPLLSLPLPLPSSSSSFSLYHHRHRHHHHHQQQPPSASFSRSFFFPSLLLCPTTPSPVRGPSGTSDRLSPPRSNARSHPPSLALSTPSPSPSRVGSSLSLSRADVTT